MLTFPELTLNLPETYSHVAFLNIFHRLIQLFSWAAFGFVFGFLHGTHKLLWQRCRECADPAEMGHREKMSTSEETGAEVGHSCLKIWKYKCRRVETTQAFTPSFALWVSSYTLKHAAMKRNGHHASFKCVRIIYKGHSAIHAFVSYLICQISGVASQPQVHMQKHLYSLWSLYSPQFMRHVNLFIFSSTK